MQKGKNAKHCFVHEMSEFASFFVLCAHALGIFHLKHHTYSMVTERTTSVHAYVHTHRPQLSIWCSCDLLINLLTDLLTHRVTDDEYHQSQRGYALSSSLYSNQLQPIKISPLRARFTCELFACDYQLLSEIIRILCWNCYTHVAASRLLLNDVCLSFLKLYFAQGCPCFPARYIKKKNSHKGRNLFFLGELMSTALQGGRSHFGEAGLSLYSLLPRI